MLRQNSHIDIDDGGDSVQDRCSSRNMLPIGIGHRYNAKVPSVQAQGHIVHSHFVSLNPPWNTV